MPDWGLTKKTRESQPFGLDEWWLEPGKVITDPLHGDVFITRLEQAFLDTAPMQRLRRVRQLGTTHLVYPGATHSRLSHSLGSVRVVQTLLDVAIGQRDRPHAVPDLFDDWEREARERFEEEPPNEQPADEEGWRKHFRLRLAEATVLARLGALLHDLGHLPFGHTLEDDLQVLTPHDENTARFELLWGRMLAGVERSAERAGDAAQIERRKTSLTELQQGGRLYSSLRPLILAKERDDEGVRIEPTEKIADYPFVADMVGNTICADLLDYLGRDHLYTGLPLSLGARYLSSFYISPKGEGGLYRQRMVLLIHRDGRKRRDVVTEILKHLRYRYELQERVLVHHTKLAADAMFGKMIEIWYQEELRRAQGLSREGFERVWKEEVPKMYQRPVEVAEPEKAVGPKEAQAREILARWSLESFFLEHGDDGLVEYLATVEEPASARELALGLRDRHLFRREANADRAAAAEDLYKKYGKSAESRRKLEGLACEHAGIEDEWKVILWIPGPEMRLKLAELLVDDGRGIGKFKDVEASGSEIYEAHKNLWTISAFMHPELPNAQRRAALAKLAQLLGISWDAQRSYLGENPDDAPLHLAAREAIEAVSAGRPLLSVDELIEEVRVGQVAARGEAQTHDGLRNQMDAIIEDRLSRHGGA